MLSTNFMLVFLGVVTDWIDEKAAQLVSWVLSMFLGLPGLMQALILIAAAILIVFGAIAVIKKSAKLIIILAAIFVVLFVIWIFI